MRALLAMTLAFCLGGCTQWRFELGASIGAFETDTAAQAMPLAEVLDRLGPPLQISATGSGFVMAWEYWVIEEDSVGFSLGLLGADFLNLDWGEMTTSGEYLLLGFDREHRVTSAELSRWDGAAGSGMAVQPFASLLPVVDSDDLRDPLPEHRWGSSLLQRPPRGLNRQSNLEESDSGIQRRGTTGSLGQHALDTSR